MDWTWLETILKGIDKDESESVYGWWETSAGAEFGARKLAELKEAIAQKFDASTTIREQSIRAFLAGFRSADELWADSHECCPGYDEYDAEPAFEAWDSAR